MDRVSCEYASGCDLECPVYKKRCMHYCQRYAASVVSYIDPGRVSVADVDNARDLEDGHVYVSVSKQVLAAALLKSLQRDLRQVKCYRFSSAVDASMADATIQEPIVYIDTFLKSREKENGLRVIETLAERCASQGKLVLLRVERGYVVAESQATWL